MLYLQERGDGCKGNCTNHTYQGNSALQRLFMTVLRQRAESSASLQPQLCTHAVSTKMSSAMSSLDHGFAAVSTSHSAGLVERLSGRSSGYLCSAAVAKKLSACAWVALERSSASAPHRAAALSALGQKHTAEERRGEERSCLFVTRRFRSKAAPEREFSASLRSLCRESPSLGSASTTCQHTSCKPAKTARLSALKGGRLPAKVHGAWLETPQGLPSSALDLSPEFGASFGVRWAL